jgi:hypothetical protein
MPQSAPRYDARLLRAIRRLDDESLSIAEVCRRVGDRAGQLGLARPSYVHVRRIVQDERARRAELREIRNEVLGRLITGRVPDPVRTLAALEDVRLGDQHRAGRPTPR